MRNLKNIRYSTWRSPAEHERRKITATAWDTSNNDSFICACGPSENDTLIELVRVQNGPVASEHVLITAWDAPCPNPDVSCDRILSLHYFGDSLTACVVLAGGDIVVIREEPLPGEDRIEIVGSVDAGISAAEWSPDEELLAITTKADTLVFMSRKFEGIMDITMSSEDLKASNHVSVGWGKKETQFKGRGAKALRDPTMPEKVDEGILSLEDSGEATISWRGDGGYLAISTIEGGKRRLIRVYSREGVLDSVTEPVDCLEGTLTWRPSGNLIAGIQRFSDRIDVVFFERNGLRHGQFTLQLTKEELLNTAKSIRLSWNSDSTVLAVALANSVQLWAMSNYHWYLKQELMAESGLASSPQPVTWHPEKPLLLLISDLDSVMCTEYIFSITRSSTTPPHDFGAVAVIDGKKLKITPFRSANVPPPMALYEIELSQNLIDVAFSTDSSIIAVLHHGGIVLYDWKNTDASSSPPNLIGRFTFSKETTKSRVFKQVEVGENGNILSLYYKPNGIAALASYCFDKDTGRMIENASIQKVSIPGLMISAFEDGNFSHPFTQGISGDFQSFKFGDNLLAECNFPFFLPWVDVSTVGNRRVAFGLSISGHLYANYRLLVKNCTSFLTTPAHLIFTTTNHLLKFVHITTIQELDVPLDDPEKDERCRSIERGARLVTAMPTSLSLVMQMPRGNLETIWPRAMVLAGIRKLVDEKNYKRAFNHCRTQRVDLNILYDHAPEQFICNVALFIDQVKKVTYIDLFLSGLREEDVTQSMYKETRTSMETVNNAVDLQNGISSSPECINSSKVNRICDAILEVLKTRTTTNLQNIITANVCKVPPALDDGLQVVAHLMNENEKMADKAVEHISFLADVNKLYDTALGLYNLDLALLVAQQSQKDPREYLPFLQKLQEMTSLRRRFSIDDHLNRYSKAISHLYEICKDDSAELEAYTVKHSLYKDALTLNRYNPDHLKKIMSLYGIYLESQSNFYEAAIAFEFLNDFGKATTCYQRAGPSYWQECLFSASQQNPALQGQPLASLATSLADSLVEAKDYQSAATIHLSYLASSATAASLLCKGYHFATALHIAAIHQPELLLPNGLIDTGLTEALSSSTELLAECKAQILAQVPRIRELRVAAVANPLTLFEGEANEDIPDNISIAASSHLSTSASLFTRYTGRQSQGTAATGVSRQTSKNRRREERKRARGKKGSVYEEEYLVASVGRLIDRVESVRDEVGRLVVALVRRGMRERAEAIEGLLGEVVDMCKKSVVEIFPAVKISDTQTQTQETSGENGYRPIGGDAVLAESIEAAGKRKIAPEIRSFTKLSLLGA